MEYSGQQGESMSDAGTVPMPKKPKAQKPRERTDYHTSGFVVRLPQEYRDKLQRVKDRTGAPYAESVRRALDAYIKALEDGAK
jgi:hypothetical protein